MARCPYPVPKAGMRYEIIKDAGLSFLHLIHGFNVIRAQFEK